MIKIDFLTELIECAAHQLPADGYDEIGGAAIIMLNANMLYNLVESLERKFVNSNKSEVKE